MSKTKEIITIEHTLKDVLKNLSDQDIQEITGKSKSYIYKCADPVSYTHLTLPTILLV